MRAKNVVAGLFAVGLLGQTPSKLEFEVASVRASVPEAPGQRRISGTRSGGPGTNAPQRINYSRMELDLILADAFGVYWDRITGLECIGEDRLDIVANVP